MFGEEKWRRSGEGERRSGGEGERRSEGEGKRRREKEKGVAHGLPMRHRIFFPFLIFFDFAGKILLLAITFFSFGILKRPANKH